MNQLINEYFDAKQKPLTAHLSIMLSGLLFLLTSQVAIAAEVDRVITIATQEWAPYQMEVGLQNDGYAIEALACVMDKLQQPYKVVFLPWGRAQLEVKQGKYDGFFSASQNSARDRYAVLSNTFIAQQWNFYLLKHTSIPLNKDAIKSNAQFGGRKHSNTTFWLQKNNYNVIHQASSLDELIHLLEKNRIGAILESDLFFEAAAKRVNIPLSDFSVVPNLDRSLGVYFGKIFLKQYPAFLDKFNQHTESCRFTSEQAN
ncbi:substrate-binding periplasmic protein [Shewanella sp. OMA3-2]|uniref:substrate-binding periplasmic protein n=1 Tax=Shewanella sp. OMA3-2 TaxID=2908650 RepID=UPI001F34F353|nr:transporter substrate-binding domain-containing protein [Shewanella sp. OMA3-2]UJF22301.1 transporter substrate-binding domain-containing protein [Shewanella sp. OMA3-2]